MLSDIVSDISARLTANGYTGTTALSARALPGNLTPPRITFVPRGSEALPPTKTTPGAPGQPPGTNQQLRYLWTRAILVDAHVWAADPARKNDYGFAEQLLTLLLQTVQSSLTLGSYQYLGEPEPSGDRSQSALGEVIVARFKFFAPVPRRPLVLAPATPAVFVAPVVNGTDVFLAALNGLLPEGGLPEVSNPIGCAGPFGHLNPSADFAAALNALVITDGCVTIDSPAGWVEGSKAFLRSYLLDLLNRMLVANGQPELVNPIGIVEAL